MSGYALQGPPGTASGLLTMEFIASLTAAGQVRTLVGLRLESWGLARWREDLCVIASELVTNAVVHGPEDGTVRVRFSREPGGVLLAVWDSSDAMPKRRVDPEGLSGRGLVMVEALASDFGAYQTCTNGKWVWARCRAA
ncbi:ATP-binding protein [Actinomadura luteofluorescens]|uniref:ATP-binding protein n=1 Tax=Actinomadura luteofluorescens TaxID=46163 RepID=UPI0034970EB6